MNGFTGCCGYLDKNNQQCLVHVMWKPEVEKRGEITKKRYARIARNLQIAPEEQFIVEVDGDLVRFIDRTRGSSGAVVNKELADEIHQMARGAFNDKGYMNGKAAREAGDKLASIKARIQVLSGNAVIQPEPSHDIGQLIANIPMEMKNATRTLA